MKYIIAGSRDLNMSFVKLVESLAYLRVKITPNDEIVAGGCPTGPDRAAKDLAQEFGIKYTEFSADWNQYGRAAGPIRNKQMAKYADALVLIWDGESPGSRNMLNEMRALGKPVYQRVIPKAVEA